MKVSIKDVLRELRRRDVRFAAGGYTTKVILILKKIEDEADKLERSITQNSELIKMVLSLAKKKPLGPDFKRNLERGVNGLREASRGLMYSRDILERMGKNEK